MRLLRPLLCLTRPDCQRNPDICNRLKVDSGRYKIVSNELVGSPELNGQQPPTEASFPVPTSGMWVDLDGDGETKNTLNFEGTGLKT
jgi:hypothetical protein